MFDSAFWGPSANIALLQGSGSVTFSACQFAQWGCSDGDSCGKPSSTMAALDVEHGSLMVQGCDFAQEGSLQVRASSDIEGAVVMGSRLAGGSRISAEDKHKIQVGFNIE